MTKFPSLPAFLIHVMLPFTFNSFSTTAVKSKLGLIRNGHKFGVINFDRISGYALVNSTYKMLNNVNVITCISECRKNKACHSLNFQTNSGGTTMCELNELDRYAADSEMAFQKKLQSDYYEIKNACRDILCQNGGRCAGDHKQGTWTCRCPLAYAGKYCEKHNSYGQSLTDPGIINNEFFRVDGKFNYPTAKVVCKAFGAHQASIADIARIAREAEFGYCAGAWTRNGNLGYPEYNGNCHVSYGSTHTGHFTHGWADQETTLRSAWCLKKNIDFCKPGWHGSYFSCYLFHDDDIGTMDEAKKKCAAKNSVVATVRFTNPSFKSFIQKVCPDCRSMYVGWMKANGIWSWLEGKAGSNIIWGPGEPQEENSCAEYNTDINALTAIPCNTPRGYMCSYNLF